MPKLVLGPNGRIFIFGFLSAIAPLSIDIYLPALPMLRQALAADEAQTLFTLSAFFIGFGVGQLLLGPLSDRFGRKPPLLAGLVLYIIASVGCAQADSMLTIVLWRFVQAFGGSVVPSAVQAMVRDLYARNQSARILSLNMLVTASAPIVAPLIGGQVLLWFDWRAIFWVLVAFGVLAFIAALALPETLDTSRRNAANPLTMLLGYFELFRNRRYVGYIACSTLYFCCLFAFIAGSPFVYIEYFGVPPQYYGFLFGVNMIGMITTTYVNSRIVIRRGADRLLLIACSIGAAGSVVLLATGLSGFGGVGRNCASVVCRVGAFDHGGVQRHFRRACRGAKPGRRRSGACRRAAIRRRRADQRGHRLVRRRYAAPDERVDLRRSGHRAPRQSRPAREAARLVPTGQFRSSCPRLSRASTS